MGKEVGGGTFLPHRSRLGPRGRGGADGRHRDVGVLHLGAGKEGERENAFPEEVDNPELGLKGRWGESGQRPAGARHVVLFVGECVSAMTRSPARVVGLGAASFAVGETCVDCLSFSRLTKSTLNFCPDTTEQGEWYSMHVAIYLYLIFPTRPTGLAR